VRTERYCIETSLVFIKGAVCRVCHIHNSCVHTAFVFMLLLLLFQSRGLVFITNDLRELFSISAMFCNKGLTANLSQTDLCVVDHSTSGTV
jgi:hypothetical protein